MSSDEVFTMEKSGVFVFQAHLGALKKFSIKILLKKEVVYNQFNSFFSNKKFQKN